MGGGGELREGGLFRGSGGRVFRLGYEGKRALEWSFDDKLTAMCTIRRGYISSRKTMARKYLTIAFYTHVEYTLIICCGNLIGANFNRSARCRRFESPPSLPPSPPPGAEIRADNFARVTQKCANVKLDGRSSRDTFQSTRKCHWNMRREVYIGKGSPRFAECEARDS